MFTPFAFVKQASPATPSYDPDAQAFINATGISGIDATAINTLVEDLKSYSLWTKMKAIYPMVGGTSTTCKYNLVNPADTDGAYRLSFVGGWTFSSTGADPNGTNAYADTFLAQTALNNNDGHISYYSRENTTGVLIGVDNNCRYSMAPHFDNIANQATHTFQSQNSTVSTAVNAQGFFVGTRTSSSIQDWYKNAIDQNISNATSFTLENYNFYLASRNNSGTATNFTAAECAFASIGDGLTSAQVTDLNTAVQAFNTTLSRNV